MDVAPFIQILVATGVLTTFGEVVRWALGRRKSRTEGAEVVQKMALDLVQPLHDELARATRTAAQLRQQMNDLDRDMEIIISWALTAKALLDRNHIDYPALPRTILDRERH